MVRRWPGEGRGRQLLGHFRQQQAAGRRSEADRSNGNDAASGEDPSGQ
jgi:hypothetical protein